jgi:hypothetical protein
MMPSVIVLDSPTASLVVSSDSTSITFSGNPTALQALNPGDIFIVDNTARKVESISYVSDQTVIQTIEPEFSEVFQTLDISGGTYIEASQLNKAALPASISVSVIPAKSQLQSQITSFEDEEGNIFTFKITDHLIYDIDGDDNTTEDRILVNGTIVLTKPYVYTYLDYKDWYEISLFRIKYAEFKFTANETVDLQFSSQKLTFNKTVKIPLGEIYIPVPITGGLASLNISLSLVFNVDGTASVVADVTQSLNLDIGLNANLSPLTLEPYNNTTHSFDFSLTQLDGELGVSASINPDFLLKALGFSLVGFNNSMGVKATIKGDSTSGSLCLRTETYAILSSTAFVAMPRAFLDINIDNLGVDSIFKMERLYHDLFRESYLLADSGNNCTTTNNSPVADAGLDKNSNAKATVLLDGMGSDDSDGFIETYSWTQTGGTQVALVNANTATPSFFAPSTVDTLTFMLTVTDDKSSTSNDSVIVNVLTGDTNLRPQAVAGADQTVNASTTVVLDGSSSYDSDGSIGAYNWTQTGGTQITLVNANTATSSFIAPSGAGTLTFKLTVTDDKGAINEDYVQVVNNSTSTNNPPVATITSPSDGTTYVQWDSITFSGSSYDVEDGTLSGGSLAWFSNIDGQIGTGTYFTRSDLSVGSHVISLTATDSSGAAGNDIVSIQVVSPTIGEISVGPASLNFGDVQVGTCSTVPFAIQHVNGTAPASGTVSADSPFNITSNSSFSLSDGQGVNVDVRFCPSSAINYTGAATIATSAVTNISTVSLAGRGINATPTTGTIQVDAALNGSGWPGSVNYTLTGATTTSGTTVPANFSNKSEGYWNLNHTSGGPSGATLTSITPSANQYLTGGGSITFTLNFTSSSPVERITNGSFSSSTSNWTLWGDFWAGTDASSYRTSPGYATGGVDSSGYAKDSANGYMYQAVSIPSGATSAMLSFWYNITSQETGSTPYDVLNVTIQNSSGGYLATVDAFSNLNKGALGVYSQKTLDVTPYIGQTIRVHFWATTDSTNPTVFRIDDVSLMSDG